MVSFSSLRANQSILGNNPSTGAEVSPSPPSRETSNGSALTITPASYRKLNAPWQLCGFACHGGTTIWEIQNCFSTQSLELNSLSTVTEFTRRYSRGNGRSFGCGPGRGCNN